MVTNVCVVRRELKGADCWNGEEFVLKRIGG